MRSTRKILRWRYWKHARHCGTVVAVYITFFFIATFFLHNKLRSHSTSTTTDHKDAPIRQTLTTLKSKHPTTTKDKEVEYKTLYAANGFNAQLSDSLPLNRTIPDLRFFQCKSQHYDIKDVTVSLVIPFHNEHLSTLLRTVASCQLNASPAKLKDVILVDDYSSKVELHEDLNRWLAKPDFAGVTVVRQHKREGLVRSRMAGVEVAKGDVVVIMDSHCECGPNWLLPLVAPIAENYRTVTCPFIDVIDMNNFEIRPQDQGQRGSWDWNSFHYKRLPLTKESLKNPEKPFESPIMAGGLFAISKKWFNELGGYDEGLDVWGGEQYELSFKLWMCGGRMMDTPCSRVAHIYRNFMPYNAPDNMGDFIQRNYKRVAEVWMDEYKSVLYNRNNPQYYQSLPAGDLSKQKEVRKRLKCKSFKWFIKNIAWDQPKYYPAILPNPAAKGTIKNVALNACVFMKFDKNVVVASHCQGGYEESNLQLTFKKDIRPMHREVCMDRGGDGIHLYPCHGSLGNQHWWYDWRTKRVLNAAECLTAVKKDQELKVLPCKENSPNQQWEWENYDTTLLNIDANSAGDFRTVAQVVT